METPKLRASPKLLCVETAQIPLQARQQQAMTSVTSRDDQVRRTQISVYVNVMAVNFSHEGIELPEATVLSAAKETSTSIVGTNNDEEILDFGY